MMYIKIWENLWSQHVLRNAWIWKGTKMAEESVQRRLTKRGREFEQVIIRSLKKLARTVHS